MQDHLRHLCEHSDREPFYFSHFKKSGDQLRNFPFFKRHFPWSEQRSEKIIQVFHRIPMRVCSDEVEKSFLSFLQGFHVFYRLRFHQKEIIHHESELSSI